MTRIALISDIHFGRDARAEFTLPEDRANGKAKNAPSLSEGAVRIMKEMQAEYLFVAGDLTSVGSPSEYFYCEEKLKEMAQNSGIKDDHVIWCVGNHDNDWSISGLMNNYTGTDENIKKILQRKYGEIATHVAQINTSGQPDFKQIGPLPMSGTYEDNNMIVFVLNSSSKCIQKDTYEHGSLTKDQLDWLQSELQKYDSDSRWKIVMMHHHPFNYPYPTQGHDISALEDGSEFCNIAGKGGVNLVIHGHRHHPICQTDNRNEWIGPVSFVCGGSFSVGERQRQDGDIPNTFHIIELTDVRGESIIYSYEYSIGSGWQKIHQHRPEVPVDYKMYLGKMFNQNEVDIAIERLFDFSEQCKVYTWDQLGEPLKYRSSSAVRILLEKAQCNSAFEVKVHSDDNTIVIQRKAV